MRHPIRSTALVALLACTAAGARLALAAPAACNATSGITVPLVVELYTSEGCSSCPPADRWLSSLQGQPDIVRLAFHVDYWDRLGWKDRFADAAYTQRQHEAGVRSGATFVYTPQVRVDGADYRGWPALPRGARPASTVLLKLARDGDAYVAQVVRGPGAPARLEGFWAVTEDGHVSRVQAGENSGATLRHDAVVRDYRKVASIGEAPLRFEPRPSAELSAGRRVQFVVTDAATGRPVQAVGC